MAILCVLPARIASERLPRKPLRIVAGRPLIEWSWRAACRVPDFDAVWVATDAEEIADCVTSFGGIAVLTSGTHASGTDRVAEAARGAGGAAFDIVVNFQADEPFLPPESVSQAVRPVREGRAEIATLAVPIASQDEWASEAVVKVVRAADGRALYFSRAPVPHQRGGGASPAWVNLRHVGLYVYTRRALERWVSLPPSPLEEAERLEQLRPLEAGMRVHVTIGSPCERGVDEQEDVARAERVLLTRNRKGKRASHV